jgi:glutamate synthase (NADPH/NADH) small chain
LKTDLVLLAMGFTGVTGVSAIPEYAQGAITVGSDFQTRRPGVFASGDATRGASLIVWAIADGRRMAAAVDRYVAITGIQISRSPLNPSPMEK